MAKKQEEQVVEKEAKLDEDMANIYDEKTKEMSFDNTDFIKMNEGHSALSSDNDTDKKIDTQISDIYKKKNKILIAIIVLLILTVLVLLGMTYTLYSNYNKLDSENKNLNKEVSRLNNEIAELKKEEEPVKYKQVFVGDSLIKNYNLSASFNGYEVVNSGKEDLTSKELLDSLNTMVFNYNPNKVFISVGLNDLTDNKDTLVSNIKEIVRKIKERDTNIEIYVFSLVPLNSSDLDSIKSINKELSELSNIKYIDIYEILMEKNGDTISPLYSDNKKELNAKGYEVLTEALLNI